MFENAFKGKNHFWRYIVTIIVGLFLSQIIGGIPLLIAILTSDATVNSTTGLIESNELSKNVLFTLEMIPFAFGFVALVLMIKYVHGRSFLDTVTNGKQFRTGHYLKGFLIWFSISALLMLFSYIEDPDNITLNFQPEQFFWLIVISIILLPIQTGLEEFFFRGYLSQGFYLIFKNKWDAVFVTAILFAGMHIFNPEVEEFGFVQMMSQYILFGLLFGFTTIMDDGIEIAWGAHTANNLFIALFVSYKSYSMQTPALFTINKIDPTADIIGFVIAAIIFGLICNWVFKWNIKFKKG